MVEIFVFIILLIAILILFFNASIRKNYYGQQLSEIKSSIGTLISNLKDTEKNLKDEFVTNRKETAEIATGLRSEVSYQLNKFTQTFSDQ